MNFNVVNIEYFPGDLPKPRPGQRNRHEAVLEFRTEVGPPKTRPDPQNSYDYYTYRWDTLNRSEYERIIAWINGILGVPIAGWRHPGEEGENVVAFFPPQTPEQKISLIPGGKTIEKFSIEARVRIIRKGAFSTH